MDLFCDECGENHHVTLGEVERLVYLGQGVGRDDNGLNEIQKNGCARMCIKDALHLGAGDPEAFLEFVDGRVEDRKLAQRRAKEGASK
jgi:hypothetical protein